MKHPGSFIAGAAFIAVLAGCGLWTVLAPQRAFSPNENRVLQTTPDLSAEALLDGTAQQEITDFVSDQFPGRDLFTAAGSAVKKALGRRDIGGAYLGRDHYYFEKITDSDIDKSRFRRNLALINELAAEHPAVPVTVVPVPSAGTVLPDKLPPFARLYDADTLYAQAQTALTACRTVDLRQPLTKAAQVQQVYYRTDHHWTMQGAAAAYAALTGKEAPAVQTVGSEFYGTLYSKTLDTAAVPDTVAKAAIPAGVTAVADGEAVPVYDEAKLKEKDKYLLYLDGNHGLVTLTGGCRNGKTLLMIKDSFANCFAPLLTADYETVLMVDLRYYPGTVRSLLASQPVDDLLFLYEMSNLANDPNLSKLPLS